MSLDGKIRLPLSTAPTDTPPTGFVYIWTEFDVVENKPVYMYKDENGVVDKLGGSGGSSNTFSWILIGSTSSQPKSGYANNYSYGHNAMQKGIVVNKSGKITRISFIINSSLNYGIIRAFPMINSVKYESYRTEIAAAGNGIGQISSVKSIHTFPTPLSFNAGDEIQVNSRATSTTNKSVKATIALTIEEDL